MAAGPSMRHGAAFSVLLRKVFYMITFFMFMILGSLAVNTPGYTKVYKGKGGAVQPDAPPPAAATEHGPRASEPWPPAEGPAGAGVASLTEVQQTDSSPQDPGEAAGPPTAEATEPEPPAEESAVAGVTSLADVQQTDSSPQGPGEAAGPPKIEAHNGGAVQPDSAPPAAAAEPGPPAAEPGPPAEGLAGAGVASLAEVRQTDSCPQGPGEAAGPPKAEAAQPEPPAEESAGAGVASLAEVQQTNSSLQGPGDAAGPPKANASASEPLAGPDPSAGSALVERIRSGFHITFSSSPGDNPDCPEEKPCEGCSMHFQEDKALTSALTIEGVSRKYAWMPAKTKHYVIFSTTKFEVQAGNKATVGIVAKVKSPPSVNSKVKYYADDFRTLHLVFASANDCTNAKLEFFRVYRRVHAQALQY